MARECAVITCVGFPGSVHCGHPQPRDGGAARAALDELRGGVAPQPAARRRSVLMRLHYTIRYDRSPVVVVGRYSTSSNITQNSWSMDKREQSGLVPELSINNLSKLSNLQLDGAKCLTNIIVI